MTQEKQWHKTHHDMVISWLPEISSHQFLQTRKPYNRWKKKYAKWKSTYICNVETFVKSSDEILEVSTGQVRSLKQRFNNTIPKNTIKCLKKSISWKVNCKIIDLLSFIAVPFEICFLHEKGKKSCEIQLFHFTPLFMSNTLTCLSKAASSCCQILSVYLILSLVLEMPLLSYFCCFLVTLLFPWNLYKYTILNQQEFLNKR